jgi:branched-chain amino acid transport system substrate-binding protein
VNHYSPDRKDTVADSFIRKYKANYGVVPDVFAALAYDASTILFKALDAAKKPDPEEIRKALGATRNHRGVTGLITIDARGDAVKSAVIMRVENSGFKYVTTINP